MHTARILVVDDDLGTVETFSHILRLRGYSVGTARTGGEALVRARERTWDVLLTDLSLPDFSGVDLLRYLQHENIRVPAIIMTAFGSISTAVEATKLGAVEYLEKPLFEDDIVSAVQKALSAFPIRTALSDAGMPQPALYAATRWVALVITVLESHRDPGTIEEWGRLAHMARATVEKRCEAAGVSPKPSLDFARVMRALRHARHCDCSLEALLDGDPRTVKRLLRFGRVPSLEQPGTLPTDGEFLDNQQFISQPFALDRLRQALAERALDSYRTRRTFDDVRNR